MRLYIVQHGDAVAKDVEPERPLSEKGRADIERLAGFLSGTGVRVGRILELASEPTLSDSTAGGVEPGSITFPMCVDLVDEFVVVSEPEIRASMAAFSSRIER